MSSFPANGGLSASVEWLNVGMAKVHFVTRQPKPTMKTRHPNFASALSAVMLISTIAPASAAVMITYAEQPDSVNSTLSNTQVFDFNTMAVGKNTKVSWNDVGSFDQLNIKNVDAYGGAVDAKHPDGSRYSVQGAGTSVLSTTLTLSKDSSYFGMWWSAGDARMSCSSSMMARSWVSLPRQA